MELVFAKGKIAIMTVLCLSIIAASSQTTFAENSTGKGKITVNNTVKEKAYSIYRIFDLTHDGNENVSYTMNEKWKDFFKGKKGKKYIIELEENVNNLNPIIVDDKIKYINITEGNIAEFSEAAMSEVSNIENDGRKIAGGATVEFDNLPLGYYMVYPEGATDKNDQSSIVSLDSTLPKVSIKQKGKYPTVEKESNKESADYGEEITYTLKTKVPDTTGFKKYKFIITDTLSKGLTLDESTIEVKINNEKISDNYTNDVKVLPEADEVEKRTEIKLTFDMMALQEKRGKEITISYKAKLNEDAIIGNTGNNNEVKLEYSNNPREEDSKEETSDEKKVYTAAVKILKLDNKNEELKLEGAEFILKNGNDESAKYYHLEDGVCTWVDNAENAKKITTDNRGIAEFKGLKDGTYYIEEVKAPEGYNKLTKDIEVIINHESHTDTEYMEVKIENSAGIKLPGVGGSGIKIFAILGGGIMLYALYSIAKTKIRRDGK